MNYIIYFDIAAIFNFFISLFLYKQHKNLPLPQNIFFFGLNICGMIATTLDILSTEFLNPAFQIPLHLCYMVNCGALFFLNSMPALYAMYIYKSTNHKMEQNEFKKILFRWVMIIPYSIELFLIFISPFIASRYNLVFSIDKNHIYHRGPGMICIYGCTALYFVLACIFLIRGRKRLAKKKVVYISSYFLIEFVTVIIQILYPNYLVIIYGISVTSIFLCCFVHTHEDVTDGITKLFNQNTFLNYTEFLFSRKIDFICLNITINNTVNIVNSIGINRFNNCLGDIGKYFSKLLKNDYGFYLGKGQFCFIIRKKQNIHLDSIISEIHNRFNRPWEIDSVDYKLESTICIIECPEDSGNPNDIINDITFVAEEIGYSRNTIYARNIDTNEKKRMAYIEHAIIKGIERKRFYVYFQPIYSTEKRRIIGAEVTPRLIDAKGRMLYPEEFMDIAERTGTILSIGNITLGSLCEILHNISPEDYGISKINVNLSVTQYMQENLVEQILFIRDKFNISPSLINLEITETAASRNIENLIHDMEFIAVQGFELVLDNFGAGYSNFDYLLKLPFRTVKIDKTIINSAYYDLRANKALETVIKMIHRLGMSVMADGIKTREQAEWLTKSGCDYLQGSYYSEPVTKDDFLLIMKKINENTSSVN